MNGEQRHSKLLNSYHKSKKSLVSRKLTELYKEREREREKEKENHKHSNSRLPIKSDKKLMNFSEMVPNLLEKIRSNNTSSLHNIILDNLSFSFGHNSNSSEIDDDRDSDRDGNSGVVIRINSPKKNTHPTINPFSLYKDDDKEFSFLETRKMRKNENSPVFNCRKYLNENKDSLITKLHKYFFQDGEMENIDTLIKYNLNKIKINDSNENKKELNENNDFDDFDYYNIKEQIFNLMDEFSDSFDKENKEQLESSIKDLRTFSQKYKFDYVKDLTSDWLLKMKDKKYDNRQLKHIGYYNQIREIIEKMLKELKKKVDFILFSQEIKNKENQNIKNTNNNRNDNLLIPNRNLQKRNSINKEDLLKTKEIKPIKIDIEVQNTLNLSEVEGLLRNLDEGDLGNFGGWNNNKKLFNRQIKIRSDNEYEAFSYPFKEDNLCHVF